jgi:hypothetical protein
MAVTSMFKWAGGGGGRGEGIMPYSTSFPLAPKFNNTYHLPQMLIIQQNDDTFKLDNCFLPCYVDDSVLLAT